MVRGEILNAHDLWEPALFLVDTGADHTVFSAALLEVLGIDPVGTGTSLGGIGGVVETVEIATRIRLPCDDGGSAVFRGRYPAFTQLESLDVCVLGRDIMQLLVRGVLATPLLVNQGTSQRNTFARPLSLGPNVVGRRVPCPHGRAIR